MLLTSSHQHQENNAEKQGRQLIVTESIQEHIWERQREGKMHWIKRFDNTNRSECSISYLRHVEGLHPDLRWDLPGCHNYTKTAWRSSITMSPSKILGDLIGTKTIVMINFETLFTIRCFHVSFWGINPQDMQLFMLIVQQSNCSLVVNLVCSEVESSKWLEMNLKSCSSQKILNLDRQLNTSAMRHDGGSSSLCSLQ